MEVSAAAVAVAVAPARTEAAAAAAVTAVPAMSAWEGVTARSTWPTFVPSPFLSLTWIVIPGVDHVYSFLTPLVGKI